MGDRGLCPPSGWAMSGVCRCLRSGRWRVCLCRRGGRWGGLLVPPGWAMRGAHLPTPLPWEGQGICACPPPRVGNGGLCQTVPPALRAGNGGLCLSPRAAGGSSPNTLITLIFPPVTQCLDGIDYDFNFSSHMMEQKEPLMETGKGPSGCALPGVPSCSGVSPQADSRPVVPSNTTGCVPAGPTVGCLGIPAPCHTGTGTVQSGPAAQSTRDLRLGCDGSPGAPRSLSARASSGPSLLSLPL